MNSRVRVSVFSTVCLVAVSGQGLTQSKPCMGYCLNVVRGCLASMAEVDPHWREFVRSLEGLSSRMHGNQDIEQVLLGVHTLVHDAVAHAQKNGPRLSAQVGALTGRFVFYGSRCSLKAS